jgi:hypothetical protein
VFLSYSEYGKRAVSCPHCRSANVRRRIGRIRIAYSEESRLEKLADPDQLAGIEEDPRALGRMMRQMSSQLGEDMGPEFDEVVDRLESGQSPEQIEEQLPELGAGENGGASLDEGGFDDDL